MALLSTHSFLIELEFGDVDFYDERVGGGEGRRGVGRDTRKPARKHPLSRNENKRQTQPIALTPGIEPEPHWWKAIALTTHLSTLPWLSCWFLRREANRRTRRKSSEQGRSGNLRTNSIRATMVGDECFHYNTIPVLPISLSSEWFNVRRTACRFGLPQIDWVVSG